MSLIVNADNFVRAETDNYLAGFAKNGALGKFAHVREPARIDKQDIVRLNRDTLYSQALFDLDAGEVTVTLPDAGPRYMALQVIDEDHYTHGVEHAPATRTLRRKDIGTRYVACLVRTLARSRRRGRPGGGPPAAGRHRRHPGRRPRRGRSARLGPGQPGQDP